MRLHNKKLILRVVLTILILTLFKWNLFLKWCTLHKFYTIKKINIKNRALKWVLLIK